MELPDPKREHESVMRQMAKTYSEAIRIGITIVGWSLAAFLVGSFAFIVVEVTWRILVIVRKVFLGI